MVALTHILFAATSVSAAVIAVRDGATVFADLKTIDTDVKGLGTAVKAWDGTTGGGASIASAESKLENDVKKVGTDMGNTPTLSASDCNTIANYLTSVLEPDVKTTLNAIVSRKTDAKNAGLQAAVTQDLKNIQSEFDTFFSKVPSSCANSVKASKTKIDSDFSTAVTSFNS